MGTHTVVWRECSRSRCYGQYHSRPLGLSSKTLGFFPKQTAKIFSWSSWGWEVQIRNCRSFPSLQMNQSSHLILASPTWHISLCLGLVPKEMSSGLEGWQEQAVLGIGSFNTSQRSIGLREKSPRPPDPPEEERLAGQLRIPRSHSPCQAGFATELSVLSNQSPLTGWQRGAQSMGTVLKVLWYERPGSEEPSAFTTPTDCQVIRK